VRQVVEGLRRLTATSAPASTTASTARCGPSRSVMKRAVVLDLFNREAVGWSIKPRMTADIVVDTLTMAWFRRKPAPGLLHQCDRGQYASGAYQDKLADFGMICSMSRKG
jgi:putative transposase